MMRARGIGARARLAALALTIGMTASFATEATPLAAWQDATPAPIEVGAGPVREQAFALVGRSVYAGDSVQMFGYLTDVIGLEPAQVFTDALPSVPLVVLTHGRADDPAERPPGWPLADEERIWRELHEELAHRIPHGRHVVAEGTGHDIHQEQPELVIESIRSVVAAVRDPITWTTPAANPATPSAPRGTPLDPAA